MSDEIRELRKTCQVLMNQKGEMRLKIETLEAEISELKQCVEDLPAVDIEFTNKKDFERWCRWIGKYEHLWKHQFDDQTR